MSSVAGRRPAAARRRTTSSTKLTVCASSRVSSCTDMSSTRHERSQQRDHQWSSNGAPGAARCRSSGPTEREPDAHDRRGSDRARPSWTARASARARSGCIAHQLAATMTASTCRQTGILRFTYRVKGVKTREAPGDAGGSHSAIWSRLSARRCRARRCPEALPRQPLPAPGVAPAAPLVATSAPLNPSLRHVFALQVVCPCPTLSVAHSA